MTPSPTNPPSDDADPRANPDGDLYAKTADVYDKRRFSGRAGRWSHRAQVQALLRLRSDWQGARVLELGCGTGRATAELAARGASILATDSTAEMLTAAQRRLASMDLVGGVEFREIDGQRTGEIPGTFDVVLAVNVFGRLSDPIGFLDAVGEHAARGAEVIFNFPNLVSALAPFGMIVNRKGKSLGRAVTSHWYTPGTVAHLSEQAGLRANGFSGHYYVPAPRALWWSAGAFALANLLFARWAPKTCPSVFVRLERARDARGD